MAPSQKTVLFVCLLVAAVAVAVPVAQALIPIVGNLLKIIIPGQVACSVNATATVGDGGVTVSPPFRNATVVLLCNGTVITKATTDKDGVYVLVASLNTIVDSVLKLLSRCQVVVTTPLVKCNATLPATGYLMGNLTNVVDSTVDGLVAVVNTTNLTLNVGLNITV